MSGGYLGGKCSIYFFNRKIHVYVTYRHHSGYTKNIDYDYVKCEDDLSNVPTDIDDYVYKTQTFFKELMRHISCLDGDDFGYTSTASYQECVSEQEPSGFCIGFGMVEPAEYQYSWDAPDTISYMTAVMKSKKYKRYRGDNQIFTVLLFCFAVVTNMLETVKH